MKIVAGIGQHHAGDVQRPGSGSPIVLPTFSGYYQAVHIAPEERGKRAMTWLWTWAGESFGYRDGDDLWTRGGKHVGRFHGDEVFDSCGRYLGEMGNDWRLIVHSAKSGRFRPGFTASATRGPRGEHGPRSPRAMPNGHTDFPSPDTF
jgi:hypothetical protein